MIEAEQLTKRYGSVTAVAHSWGRCCLHRETPDSSLPRRPYRPPQVNHRCLGHAVLAQDHTGRQEFA